MTVGTLTYSFSNVYLGPYRRYLVQPVEGSVQSDRWDEDLVRRMGDWIAWNHDDRRRNGQLLLVSQLLLILGIGLVALAVALSSGETNDRYNPRRGGRAASAVIGRARTAYRKRCGVGLPSVTATAHRLSLAARQVYERAGVCRVDRREGVGVVDPVGMPEERVLAGVVMVCSPPGVFRR